MKRFRGVLRYKGWGIYKDSGHRFRRWKFTEAVPGLDARAGDRLDDLGPEGDPRFCIRGDDGDRFPDREDVKAFFEDWFPEWDPPNDAEIRLQRKLGSGGSGARAMSQFLRQMAGALRTGSGEGASATDNEGLQYGALVLEREGHYGNTGGRFRVWRFVEDRTEIPATELSHYPDLDGESHAMEGDALWQQPDRLEPFRLKREDCEIGSPERWQVVEAFGGEIPGWPLEADDSSDTEGEDSAGDEGPAPGLMRYVSEKTVDGRDVRADHTDGSGIYHPRRGVYRFTRSFPDLDMSAGDALVLAYDREDRPAQMKGEARGLDPDEIEELRDALRGVWGGLDPSEWPQGMPSLPAAVRKSFVCLSGPESAMIGGKESYGWQKRGLCYFLDNANRWGRRLSEFHHRLFHLRPACRGPGDVTRPIRAVSDESAAFELLAQVAEDAA